MAPKVVEAVAGPAAAAKDFKKESNAARILGSGSAGIAELAIFHPVDTIAKRLMSNEGKMNPSMLNQVIFKDKAHASAGRKFASLFPGLGYAAGYKVRPCMKELLGKILLRPVIDFTKDLQIWRTAICSRLSSVELR